MTSQTPRRGRRVHNGDNRGICPTERARRAARGGGGASLMCCDAAAGDDHPHGVELPKHLRHLTQRHSGITPLRGYQPPRSPYEPAPPVELKCASGGR